MALLGAGCGGSLQLLASKARSTSRSVKPAATHGAFGGRADPTAVAVIRDWANALRGGNVALAASYFAVPSIYANGVDAHGNLVALRIRSRAAAILINRELPCGAVFVAAEPPGRTSVCSSG